MNKFLKTLFLALCLAPLFMACSKDDDGGSDNATIKTFSVAIGEDEYKQTTFIFTWSKVTDAYRYVVLYKEKNDSAAEWNSSNWIMAMPNDGEIITKSAMGGYVKGIDYQMQIVAYRDSQSSTIIAKSDIIEGIIPIPE